MIQSFFETQPKEKPTFADRTISLRSARRVRGAGHKNRQRSDAAERGTVNRFGVRGKLLLSVGVLASGYLLFLGLVQWTSSTTQRHLVTLSDSLLPAALDIANAQAGYKKLRKDYESAVLLQDASNLQVADKDREAVLERLREADDKTAFSPELHAQTSALLDQLTTAEQKAKTTYAAMINPTAAVTDATQAAITALAADQQKLEVGFDALNDAVGKKAFQHELDGVTESNQHQRMLALFLFLLAAGVAALTIFLMERQVSGPLRDVAQRLSEGADQVSSAARQVSTSGASIAQGASQQAASLQETSASSEEISSMARRSAEDCRQTAELVGASQAKVSTANRSLGELVTAMEAIRASSGKVSKIIKLIDEIAFKTNILALNAAVEAARAGDAGMGFAVVAEEVRNLARQCADAAKDSSEIVEESMRRSNDGKVKLDEVASSIEAVTQDSLKIKSLVDQVATASTEQTSGIAQIARSIQHMEKLTQSSAGTAQESATAAEELTSQSGVLQEIVLNLTTIVSGSAQEVAGRSSAFNS